MYYIYYLPSTNICMTEKKNPVGRPKLPKAQFRKVFSLRFSPPEKERVEKAAKAAKKPTTQWARETLLAAAE